MEFSVPCPSEEQPATLEDEEINKLHAELARQPDLLEDIDKKPLVNFRLHEAAADGKTHLAMELATLKPLWPRKLNPEGLSPMHLALQERRIQTVRGMMTIDHELIRVKGRNNFTLLHYAAEIGEDEILAEFLCACPESIKDLTSRCETAVHVAVKNQNLKAFEVLFGWLRLVNLEEVLQWKDEDDNTVLHLAALTNQPEVVKKLTERRKTTLGKRTVRVNAKNSAGKTPLDVYEEQSPKNEKVGKILRRAGAKRADPGRPTNFTTLAGYLTTKLAFTERRDREFGTSNPITQGKSDWDVRNTVLVIAILIATAAYQAIMSPPGGFWQNDYFPVNNTAIDPTRTNIFKGGHFAGQMVMRSKSLYFFLVANTLAFISSLVTILIVIAGLPYARLLSVSLGFLLITYLMPIGVNADPTFDFSTLISYGLMACLIVICWFGTSALTWKTERLKRRINTPWRFVGDFLHKV